MFHRLTLEASKLNPSLSQSGGMVQVKAESGEVTDTQHDTPPLPDVPGSSSESSKESKPQCLLENLLGDVYVTHVQPSKSSLDVCSAEVTHYQEEPPISLSADPLSWWKSNAYKYPWMAKLAQAYLCVPATNAPAERVFSTAGDIVTA